MALNTVEISEHDRSFELYLAALSTGDRITRSFAAELLGEMGDTRAIEPLRSALTNAESPVRDYVEKALVKLGA